MLYRAPVTSTYNKSKLTSQQSSGAAVDSYTPLLLAMSPLKINQGNTVTCRPSSAFDQASGNHRLGSRPNLLYKPVL